MLKDLPVCERCGWNMLPGREADHRARECRPKAGKAADALVAATLPGYATKLGYGDGKLTFNFNEDRSITLRCYEDGTFDVEHVHWLGELDAESARALVLALHGQRARGVPDPCTDCNGTGYDGSNPCCSCFGQGDTTVARRMAGPKEDTT